MNKQPMIQCGIEGKLANNEIKKILQMNGGMVFKYIKCHDDFFHTFCEGAFGYTNDLAGKTLRDFTDEFEDFNKVAEHYEKAWQGNLVTFEAKTANGERYLMKMTPVKEDGQVTEVIACCVDITAWYVEKELEMAKRKEAERCYRTMIENLPDAVIIHDGEEIKYINGAGVTLFGAGSKEEVIGRSIWTFVHQDFHPIVRRRFRQVIEKGNKADWFCEKFVRLDGKEIDVEVTTIPFYDNDKKRMQSLIRDVAAFRHFELLKKSERLAVLGELAAGIAHEIRNPLTSLRGFTQLLQARLDGGNKEFCDIMLSELDRINEIVGELLLMAKPRDEKYQTIRLNPLIDQTVTLFQSQANLYNVQMIVRIDDSNAVVYGEANQLKQVLINIIKNAIEAMPNGGRLTIALRRKEKNTIAIAISDTGIGIPQHSLKKLGKPFYTTKESGTGLGLMICYNIIQQHGGDIFVTSKVNQGTTIEIVLPSSSE